MFVRLQVPTDKLVKDFDSNEAETDKTNPYHGVLTLTIQSKGTDHHSGSFPRGRGRPPISDISIDDVIEMDDPVGYKELEPN